MGLALLFFTDIIRMRWEENVECMVEKKWMHSGGRKPLIKEEIAFKIREYMGGY
jgi:hypothetical protein